jgi:hypothetical protein
LRVLTVLWGAEQLLDGSLGTLAAATLPTDAVPLLTRVLSLLLLALTVAATAAGARRFRARHGVPLFGTPGIADPAEARQPAPHGIGEQTSGAVGDVGWHPCTRSGRPG